MPEEKKDGFTDLAAENQKVHDKLVSQGTPNLTPEFNADTGSALDKLFEERKKEQEKEPDETLAEVEPKKADAAPEPEKKEGDGAEPEKKEEGAEPKPAAPAPEPEKKSDEVPDEFKDAPQLPEGASRKSHEAFAFVKTQAAQRYKEYEQKLSAAQEEINALKTKLSDPVPEETKKELEELRKFRTKLDIDVDPQFQKMTRDMSQAEEFIYAQLLKSPSINEETIKQIKTYGGPTAVKMDKILATVEDGTIRRLVESKLADIELMKFNREQAVRTAKENVDQYLSERRKAWEESAIAHNRATEQQLSTFLGGLTWTKEQVTKPGATEDEKKQVSEHNQFVRQIQSDLKEALNDDSPKMRATLLTGMAQLLYLQPQHKAALDRLQALEAENTDLKAKLEKFKKASVGRLKDSAAPAPGGRPMPKKEEDVFSARPGDALDAIRNQIITERSRASA